MKWSDANGASGCLFVVIVILGAGIALLMRRCDALLSLTGGVR